MADRAKVKNIVVKSGIGMDIIRMLGAEPANELFEVILNNGIVGIQLGLPQNTDATIVNLVNDFLDKEILNFSRTGNALQSLGAKLNSQGTLSGLLNGPGTKPEAQYALAADDNSTKAAKWICTASNTVGAGGGGPVQNIKSMIDEAIRAQTPMIIWDSVKTINSLCMTDGGRAQPRGPNIAPSSPLPSSMGGEVLLKNAMQFLTGKAPNNATGWKDLGCYLLGAVVGSHGFQDANGRTARVLYSICHIRSGEPFAAPTPEIEGQLNQLPAA